MKNESDLIISLKGKSQGLPAVPRTYESSPSLSLPLFLFFLTVQAPQKIGMGLGGGGGFRMLHIKKNRL